MRLILLLGFLAALIPTSLACPPPSDTPSPPPNAVAVCSRPRAAGTSCYVSNNDLYKTNTDDANKYYYVSSAGCHTTKNCPPGQVFLTSTCSCQCVIPTIPVAANPNTKCGTNPNTLKWSHDTDETKYFTLTSSCVFTTAQTCSSGPFVAGDTCACMTSSSMSLCSDFNQKDSEECENTANTETWTLSKHKGNYLQYYRVFDDGTCAELNCTSNKQFYPHDDCKCRCPTPNVGNDDSCQASNGKLLMGYLGDNKRYLQFTDNCLTYTTRNCSTGTYFDSRNEVCSCQSYQKCTAILTDNPTSCTLTLINGTLLTRTAYIGHPSKYYSVDDAGYCYEQECEIDGESFSEAECACVCEQPENGDQNRVCKDGRFMAHATDLTKYFNFATQCNPTESSCATGLYWDYREDKCMCSPSRECSRISPNTVGTSCTYNGPNLPGIPTNSILAVDTSGTNKFFQLSSAFVPTAWCSAKTCPGSMVFDLSLCRCHCQDAILIPDQTKHCQASATEGRFQVDEDTYAAYTTSGCSSVDCAAGSLFDLTDCRCECDDPIEGGDSSKICTFAGASRMAKTDDWNSYFALDAGLCSTGSVSCSGITPFFDYRSSVCACSAKKLCTAITSVGTLCTTKAGVKRRGHESDLSKYYIVDSDGWCEPSATTCGTGKTFNSDLCDCVCASITNADYTRTCMSGSKLVVGHATDHTKYITLASSCTGTHATTICTGGRGFNHLTCGCSFTFPCSALNGENDCEDESANPPIARKYTSSGTVAFYNVTTVNSVEMCSKSSCTSPDVFDTTTCNCGCSPIPDGASTEGCADATKRYYASAQAGSYQSYYSKLKSNCVDSPGGVQNCPNTQVFATGDPVCGCTYSMACSRLPSDVGQCGGGTSLDPHRKPHPTNVNQYFTKVDTQCVLSLCATNQEFQADGIDCGCRVPNPAVADSSQKCIEQSTKNLLMAHKTESNKYFRFSYSATATTLKDDTSYEECVGGYFDFTQCKCATSQCGGLPSVDQTQTPCAANKLSHTGHNQLYYVNDGSKCTLASCEAGKHYNHDLCDCGWPLPEDGAKTCLFSGVQRSSSKTIPSRYFTYNAVTGATSAQTCSTVGSTNFDPTSGVCDCATEAPCASITAKAASSCTCTECDGSPSRYASSTTGSSYYYAVAGADCTTTTCPTGQFFDPNVEPLFDLVYGCNCRCPYPPGDDGAICYHDDTVDTIRKPIADGSLAGFKSVTAASPCSTATTQCLANQYFDPIETCACVTWSACGDTATEFSCLHSASGEKRRAHSASSHFYFVEENSLCKLRVCMPGQTFDGVSCSCQTLANCPVAGTSCGENGHKYRSDATSIFKQYVENDGKCAPQNCPANRRYWSKVLTDDSYDERTEFGTGGLALGPSAWCGCDCVIPVDLTHNYDPGAQCLFGADEVRRVGSASDSSKYGEFNDNCLISVRTCETSTDMFDWHSTCQCQASLDCGKIISIATCTNPSTALYGDEDMNEIYYTSTDGGNTCSKNVCPSGQVFSVDHCRCVCNEIANPGGETRYCWTAELGERFADADLNGFTQWDDSCNAASYESEPCNGNTIFNFDTCTCSANTDIEHFDHDGVTAAVGSECGTSDKYPDTGTHDDTDKWYYTIAGSVVTRVKCFGSAEFSTTTCACVCPENYFGSSCDVYCLASSTCNGNGDCDTTSGECTCDSDYYGSACAVFCIADTTCGENGDCSDSGQCVCDANYFGTNCATYCLASETCNGNGVCSSSGQCTCSSNYDPATNCLPPEIRLTGYSDSNSGILEISYNGVWGTVCDDGFGTADAQVACRQLGLGTTDVGVYSAFNSRFTRSASYASSSILLDDLSCSGSENYLAVCGHNGIGTNNCNHNEDVAISCESTVFACLASCSNGDCDASGVCTCDDNYFGTYCTTYCLASSTCNDNGDCSASGQCVCDTNYYGAYCATLCIAESTCSGNGDCNSSGQCVCDENYYGSDCSTYCLASTTCTTNRICSSSGQCTCNTNYYDASNDCASPPLRLTGHSRSDTGILEVYYNGAWGTVCDDNFDLNDAQVACRQLGYGTTDVSFYCCNNNMFTRSDGYASTSIVLDDLGCSGSESHLGSCNHNTFLSHNCGHGEDVGISCQASALA